MITSMDGYTIETETVGSDNTSVIRKEDYRGVEMTCYNPHCFWTVKGIDSMFTGRLEATLAVDAMLAAKAATSVKKKEKVN